AVSVLRAVGVREERSKVLREPVMERKGRLTRRASRLIACGELDAVGREAVTEQRQARSLGGREVIEHGQQNCAHVSSSYGEARGGAGSASSGGILPPPGLTRVMYPWVANMFT